MWLEDVCDPLDFETQSAVTAVYEGPIASGEALFSVAEAKLLDRHGGLRRDRDILLFDPVHCYGLPGYLDIIETMETRGWKRSAFWPHGGHLFSLHVASALSLGGTEVNPSSFQPFGGLADGAVLSAGCASPTDLPGIGFEGIEALDHLFRRL
jgi:L-alanine-DL-glutamate epimerase-like enolase superfamily enzyme